jgi:hypothetical protein
MEIEPVTEKIAHEKPKQTSQNTGQMMNPKTAYSLVNFIPILSKLYGKGSEPNHQIEAHFIQLCREPKNSHIIRCKLSKGKFFGHLNKSFITTQNKK